MLSTKPFVFWAVVSMCVLMLVACGDGASTSSSGKWAQAEQDSARAYCLRQASDIPGLDTTRMCDCFTQEVAQVVPSYAELMALRDQPHAALEDMVSACMQQAFVAPTGWTEADADSLLATCHTYLFDQLPEDLRTTMQRDTFCTCLLQESVSRYPNYRSLQANSSVEDAQEIGIVCIEHSRKATPAP